MPNFFLEYVNEQPVISGEDAHHIIKSLRMKVGDKLSINDTYGIRYDCEIEKITGDSVYLTVIEKKECNSEANLRVTLYQGLPKGSKSDYIVQKCVELGIYKITFVSMDRSIVKLSGKNIDKKLIRWNKIALSAAKQSGRGIVPEVTYCENIDSAVKQASKDDLSIFFYELTGEKPDKFLDSDCLHTMSVFVGPEGGFSFKEVEKLRCAKIEPVTLGKRILRTETAPVVALSIIMYATGNML